MCPQWVWVAQGDRVSATFTPELWAAIAACLGGVGGFVRWVVVRWERGQNAVADEVFEMRILMAAFLERERIRDARRRRESSMPPPRHHGRGASPATSTEFDEEESTDRIALVEKQRSVLGRPRSERPPRPGTHHDRKDEA